MSNIRPPVPRVVHGNPNTYRLTKDQFGTMRLQGGYGWRSWPKCGTEWRDIPTVEIVTQCDLKTLADFNAQRGAAYEMRHTAMGAPRPNGIACPKCGAELVDTAPGTTLTSSPPQKYIGCQSCDFTGYRIA